MLTLRPSQVPEYLRTSKFFLELNAVEDDEFSIPTNHMKQNTDVRTLADMSELLNSIRFWGSDFFPRAMVDFAESKPYETIKSIVEPYYSDLRVIATVCLIASEETNSHVRLEKAMESGNIDVVRYFRFRNKKAVPFSSRAIALAAGRGALDCLQYALANRVVYPPSSSNTVYSEAVRNGRMDAILFLHQKHFPLRPPASHYYTSTGPAKYVDLIQIAASVGHCDILKFLHKNGCYINAAAITAADAGHFDCVEYAMSNGALLPREHPFAPQMRSVAQRLASAGYLKLFPLAVARGSRVDTDTALLFAGSGNLEYLKLCMEHGAGLSMEIVAKAAQKGNLACLQYLQEIFSLKSARVNWLTYAARGDHHALSSFDLAQRTADARQWECLRFLIEHGCPMNKSLTTYLIQEHQLELYHLATAHGCSVSLQVGCKFATDGNLTELQHAMEHGCGPSEKVTRKAAQHGHLQCLVYAYAQGCRISSSAALAAARGGHLECLKYAIDHGARLNKKLLATVAQKGLACFQSLHSVCAHEEGRGGNGMEWITNLSSGTVRPVDVVQMAVRAHQWECVRFLITHGCPMYKSLTTYCVQAGQIELYHLAIQHGSSVSVQVASKFAADGNLIELQHALEHGCERSEEIVRAAARHGRLQCLIYAHAQGCPWSVEVTLAAARGGHLKCLKYLHEHGCPWDARVRSARRKQYIFEYADQHNCPLEM